MVKQEPVNLKHQTIFALIPYVNFYAYYRIQKLGMLFLIYVLAAVVMISISLFMVFGKSFLGGSVEDTVSVYEQTMLLGEPPISYFSYVVGAVLNVYLIRRWSKKWNEQFSENLVTDETK